MDEQVQIQLNSYKNIDSVNVDSYLIAEIQNKEGQILEYDIANALSATEIFDAEREANDVYRIYGRLEYMSLLNGLSTKYNDLGAFFANSGGTTVKNIFNSFDFYLLKAANSGYTHIIPGNVVNNVEFIIDEKFDNWVTASPSNYPFGWVVSPTTNSYVQQTPSNQAQFVLDNNLLFGTPFNLISMRYDLPTPASGELIIETNVSCSTAINQSTDLFTLVIYSNSSLLQTIPLFSTGAGHKIYNLSVGVGTPITTITINANSSNKSMYMDYFKLYKTGYTESITTLNSTIEYVRYFEVIATPQDFEIYTAGFSNNVYGEQIYAFNFNKDFNVAPYVDNFNFPATELFLYPQYKPSTNGNSPPQAETMLRTSWGTDGTPQRVQFVPTTLAIGDRIYGDLIEYGAAIFFQEQLAPQLYYITTPYKDVITKYLQWVYNPFIPLRLKYFDETLNQANTGSTSYSQQVSIPYYATEYPEGTGNFVWKNILPQGFIDPVTNQGVDYPFINQRRYLFSKIILDISPNITGNFIDSNTYAVFTEIKFNAPIKINTAPRVDDLNNIGKPCQ